MNDHDQKRLEANRVLVRLLAEAVEASPSQRFGQILRNRGFVNQIDGKSHSGYIWADEFEVEPWDLLTRVERG